MASRTIWSMNSAVISGQPPRPWVAPTSIFVAALLLYSINLNRPPHPDELHHVLAAQHLWETGRPSIGDGEYVRGILHTWMVALSYKAFGESLASARLPAVVFVALVAPLLFVWVRREAGNLAAWLTAVLFLTSPFAVEIAQFSRFYALQIFSFTAGAMCAYYALATGNTGWRSALLAAAAAGMFALAVWLQVTTFMGLIAIAIWITGVLVWKFAVFSSSDAASRNRKFVAALIIAAILAIVAIVVLSKWQWAVERYRYAPMFAAETVDEFWYYHVRFLLLYPTLWTLVGVLAIAAVLRNAGLAWLAIVVFGVSFLLASFAGQKEMRYFCFAQPFIAMLWGLGLAQVAPELAAWLRSSRQRLQLGFSGGVLTFLVLVSVVVMNPFWLRTATVIGNVALPGEKSATDWRAARDVLTPWIAKAEIVITTEELGAIYFLGRSDVRYSPNKIREIRDDRRHEFGIDPRLGLPIISEPGSVEKLMTCFNSGIVVGPAEHWGNPILIGEPEQAIIRAHARPIEVPRKSHLYAWGWSRQAVERPAYCAGLERFSGLPAAP